MEFGFREPGAAWSKPTGTDPLGNPTPKAANPLGMLLLASAWFFGLSLGFQEHGRGLQPPLVCRVSPQSLPSSWEDAASRVLENWAWMKPAESCAGLVSE